MSTDYRALCAELLDEVAARPLILDRELIARARAALAQPEPEVMGPSDEELLELTEDWPATTGPRHDLSGCPEVPLYSVFADEVVEFARAALARWGHQLAPLAKVGCPACEGVPKPGNQPCAVCGRSALSAEGEVAELVWWLRSLEDASVWFESGSPEALKLTRAADLLERQAATEDCSATAPVPVAVSERLPQPEDCDAEGRCWFLRFPFDYSRESWSLEDRTYGCNTGFTHWLPAHALPLPSGEAQP